MARTAITPTALVKNSSISTAAGTTIDSTLVSNGAKVAAAAANCERMFIRVTNTNGTARVVTIKAGANPPAWAAGQGDLAVTVALTSGDVLIGPLESGRFLQADGTINIDFGTSMTGAITVYTLPRAV
jgi:hypothetical protein